MGLNNCEICGAAAREIKLAEIMYVDLCRKHEREYILTCNIFDHAEWASFINFQRNNIIWDADMSKRVTELHRKFVKGILAWLEKKKKDLQLSSNSCVSEGGGV